MVLNLKKFVVDDEGRIEASEACIPDVIDDLKVQHGMSLREVAEAADISLNRLNSLKYGEVRWVYSYELDALYGVKDRIERGGYVPERMRPASEVEHMIPDRIVEAFHYEVLSVLGEEFKLSDLDVRGLINYYKIYHGISVAELGDAVGIKEARLNNLKYGSLKRAYPEELNALRGLKERIEKGDYISDEYKESSESGLDGEETGYLVDVDNLKQLMVFYKEQYLMTYREIAEFVGMKDSRLRNMMSGFVEKIKPFETNKLWGLNEKIEKGEYVPERFSQFGSEVQKAFRVDVDADNLRQLLEYYKETYGMSFRETSEVIAVSDRRISGLLQGDVRRIKDFEADKLWGLDEMIKNGEYVPKCFSGFNGEISGVIGRVSLVDVDADNLRQLLEYYKETHGMSFRETSEIISSSRMRISNLLYGGARRIREFEVDILCGLDDKIENGEYVPEGQG